MQSIQQEAFVSFSAVQPPSYTYLCAISFHLMKRDCLKNYKLQVQSLGMTIMH